MGAASAIAFLLTIHVSLDQGGGLSTPQLAEVVDQIRQIWQPAGIDVTSGRYGEPAPPGSVIVSLRLLQAPARRDGESTILAWVSLEPTGRPAPALFVSLPGVAELLSHLDVNGRPFAQRPQRLRDQLLARAIGRVAAHELGHFLLNTPAHEDAGLLRAAYSARDLVGPWLHPFQVMPGEWPVARSEITRLAEAQLVTP